MLLIEVPFVDDLTVFAGDGDKSIVVIKPAGKSMDNSM